MNREDRHIVIVGKAQKAALMAAMLLAGGTTVAQVTVHGNVYGGGNLADVGGSVTVNIKGGIVEKDVYGGGALANTNTNNWDATANDGAGGWATGMYNETDGTTTNTTTVNLTGGTVKGDAHGGGLGRIGVEAKDAVDGVHFTAGEIAAAQEGDPAYGKTVDDWKVAPATAVAAVAEVKAMVYGDVNVTLGSSDGGSATKFYITHYDGDHAGVVKSGRVFGCNNLNGSPLGDVTVTVNKTVKGNVERSEKANKSSNDAKYELAAVYGGGNLANYTATGKKTHVIINGCDEPSIEYVYGGGNAAAVPEASVDIKGAYEIGYVFGGGNGADEYTLDGGTTWNTNPGANVNGNATTELYAGTIHEAFGGSNEKGTISGTVSIDTHSNTNTDAGDYCALSLGKLYGAGKNADIEGDLIVTLGCMPGDENPTDEVYGGAENANVKGNVELTITSGSFHKVFGGNNQSGAIFGHIKLNIEETGCNPIKIDELYLGGNEAAYSVYGYKNTADEGDAPVYVARTSTEDGSAVTFDFNTHTKPDATSGQYDDPVLNVISATRIGKVFGGGLGSGATLYGNPKVNINMAPGAYASDIDADGDGTADGNGTAIALIGDVFGGGNEATVEGNTYVNIATEVGKEYTLNNSEKVTVPGAYITGSVYGGGNAADVTGNTYVTMAGGFVFDGVYGGGLQGSVGTVTDWVTSADHASDKKHGDKDCIGGKPKTIDSNTGLCTVVVSGGQVGPLETAMTDGGMKNTGRYFKNEGDEDGPVDVGFVFGAGRGDVIDPDEDADADFYTYVRETDVTISGTALVMASVYGGGENGRVLENTKVKIQGGQIGCGEGQTAAYAENTFINPTTTEVTVSNALDECTSWDYGEDTNNDGNIDQYKCLPYDPLADEDDTDASTTGSDGHTYYGSVFGGGSGYYPYAKSKWLRSAGLVEGNTEVEITGGHILTAVYGGNELTDVGGKCTVKMSGGTIGVPRTLNTIIGHPVTCSLYGAGKGDERTLFNKWTNVGSVEVEISGGIIYGSVFGGGEDGHVLGDVEMTIKDAAVIGTWGTSYVDGNVFGGGRGFGGTAYTAGNVAGSITMNIEGGNILGSVYGGGRLGSVGYGLFETDEEGYGEMRADTDTEEGFSTSGFFTKGRGHVNMTITGGTIGNTHEYIIPKTGEGGNTPTTITQLDFTKWTTTADGDWDKWKKHNNIPNTEFDTSTGRLSHTKSGNVFAGGMGRRTKLDGETAISLTDDGIDWTKLGAVKSTKLTISGDNTKILGNVYGGGELGAVLAYTDDTTVQGGTTEIDIQGGTIGSEIKDDDAVVYTFGSVYGGGMGDENDLTTYDDIGGSVKGSTKVSMSGGAVKASVYGGGELAIVEGSHDSKNADFAAGTEINISGGTIGKDKVTVGTSDVYFGGATMGNVYGGGKGSLNTKDAGLIKKNALIKVSGSSAKIYHNIYGGGAYGSVGTFNEGGNYSTPSTCEAGTGIAEIIITGGTIGIDGNENGMVFGSSRGDVQMAIDGADPNNPLAWVNNANVVIGTDGGSVNDLAIKGSVYGGGENGHVLADTKIDIHSGTIGIETGSPVNDLSGVAFPNRGNVYGGGCGTDYFTVEGKNYFNKTAGIVRGSSTITMDGGHVVRNIYGGGAMGSVGGYSRTTKGDDDTYKENDYVPAVLSDNATGKCTVTIRGGQVGVDGNDNGMVFAAGRGMVVDPAEYPNYERVIYTNNTELTVSGTAYVKGSVYGGSESGHVWGDTKVTIAGGTVGSSVFGGGEAGYVRGGVEVNVTGGTVTSDVYGGGALASTQIGNWNETNGTWAAGKTSVSKTTLVSLTGGTIGGDAYGGGLGRKEVAGVTPIAAMVYGDVTVELNKDKTADDKGCIVDKIFGCNNLNGTPKGHVQVYVYATQNKATDYTTIGSNKTEELRHTGFETEGTATTYDMAAVYGGGNLSPYDPADAYSTNTATQEAAQTEVYISGCDLTSIKQVYGGGNAAPVPATYVRVDGNYEIEELFGGGNGKDAYVFNNQYYKNPGANVGYKDFTSLDGGGTGTQADPFTCVDNDNAKTKEGRQAAANNYMYGSGITHIEIFGGTIRASYAGSNEKGNVRELLWSKYEEGGDCNFNVPETYGGGKNSEVDGEVRLDLGCTKYMPMIFGGSKNADVNSDIVLNIVNGRYDQVYGGNNTSGNVNGSITVNIKEDGCVPINIGELYLGGYLAPYSIYGYHSNGSPRTKAEYDNLSSEEKDAIVVRKDPRINVISASHIGDIYGGGYRAAVIGNPHINVNMEKGKVEVTRTLKEGTTDEYIYKDDNNTEYDSNTIETIGGKYYSILEIGKIGNIYGGGNMADIDGDTYVEIGTGTEYDDNDELVEIIPARNAAEITGSVFGGGNHADVTGNTSVTMANGSVENRIFGGGNLGSVGVYTTTVPDGHSHEGDCIEKPTTCASGGTCNVTISGGRVGPTDMAMPQNFGYVFGASRGETEDPDMVPDINFRTYVNETHVTINGTAFITGGVYGGSENGRVLKDTYVTIDGDCQIGCGEGKTQAYTTDEWSSGDPLIPTAHWPYENPWTPYDEHAYNETTASKTKGTDGHTFYGNVFGGGSGYFPYLKKKTSDSDPDEYEWLPSAGLVEGDTHLTISGGHILTNVYGGNEMTDVSGTCYVTMTGGTIGVPRTVDGIQGHPVIGNLFGAGKGDQRVHFNKRTNVDNTEVSVTGGTIYGSVFGGGEDGHVMKNTKVTVGGDAVIGTWGYSGFDGNVFGGGRGFSGDALTAGNVGGTVEVNIEGGTMLGSVYGGGRLASVGYGLYNVDETGYGVMRDDGKDDAGNTVEGFKRGYVTVNISGGTIGNDTESTLTHTKGGNVYGGSMGRLTLIDGTTISLIWPKLAKVKKAEVNISGGTIKSNVYGGGELGTVHTDTKVIVTDGTINRNLFGGGYGSDNYTTTTDGYTPMQLAGRVDGTTTVEVNGGWVKKNVYGGGEMASVGVMTLGEKHESETTSFALSWPYASSYAVEDNGNTYVTVTGGRVGITGKDKMGNKNDKGKDVKEDNGDVYGAGKGLAGDRYIMAQCANVNNSTVSIEYTNGTTDPKVATNTNESGNGDCIAGSVYGGGENGHVIGNTQLTMRGGLVGHTLYGGGKGKDTYTTTLRVKDANGKKPGEDGYTETTGDVEIYSITAGKVYGNTTVTMSGGRVVRNIYGGGNMASVGKGNYSGGSDDYSTVGYGETITGNLWTNSYFMDSGKSTVTISGGTVGAVQTELEEGEDDMKDDLIFGNVFGGCRGEAAPNVSQTLSPRIHYYPEFYTGYVNEAKVNIDGGTVLGSVYGGGEDGHVRRGTQVNVNGGEIGLAYTEVNQNYVGKNNKGNPYKITSDRWQQRGNVYGSGSGIGKYDTGEVDDSNEAIMAYSYSAGSVTQSTEVNIKGGTVYKNVYGGGSLSTVGPPKIGQTAEPTKAQSLNKVTIDGGTVGEATGYAEGYGGNVYGASRGYANFNLDPSVFTTTEYTEVNMKNGSVIGSIFGGGEIGAVKHDTEVQLTGGTIGHDAFGGGHAAEVGGDATVELNKGVAQDAKGCVVDRVFGANDESGTPKGHVLVHVYATQNASKNDIATKDEEAYDVAKVFGGGNQADYVPAAADTKQSTEVIIEGCDLTSIEEVYGGGYGAAVPATDVLIKGTKIIDNVFGGGYGAGADNPGANVGKTTAGSDYGTGKALVRLMAGNVHNVYGGSNTKGDIREGSSINTEAKAGNGCCETLNVDEIYGGGRNAAMYGGAEIVLGCMPNDWVGAIYAGAENADVHNDVSLTLTSGKFGRVFGGNNAGGIIDGYIEVNIEENPECDTPVIIGELYGGGNQAPYATPSGYGADYLSPRVNVRAFTSIGNIFGGGYGRSAVVTGNTSVTIDEIEGGRAYDVTEDNGVPTLIDGTNVRLYSRKSTDKMGVIGNVYGGGNAAKVNGNTNVTIGTQSEVVLVSTGETKSVIGADIRGNVYGGGNAADVSGKTNVVIGKNNNE